ncbi:MAG TPA: hypothetical protein VHD34_07210, partial [Xanthobacteraceae bacterium]|nr:hypothetical protein [Xanthobacteraceae bacterium]
DDRRIATTWIDRMSLIPPGTALPTGTFQGANIFFLREVFEKAGKFRDDMGSGTPFPCEDIEFGARCSFAGLTGVLTPLVKVYHHHRRKFGSKEAAETLVGYDSGRGAYYGSLVIDGRTEAWKLWLATTYMQGKTPSRAVLQRIEREFRGAADYIRFRLEKGDTPGAEPAENAVQDNPEKPSPKPAQAAKG